jgi:zinc transporter 1
VDLAVSVYFLLQGKEVMGRFSGKKCRLVSMFWLTLFFFLVEIVVGYVTNSMALVADSFHMLSDVAALVVAFLSVKVRQDNLCA